MRYKSVMEKCFTKVGLNVESSTDIEKPKGSIEAYIYIR